MAKVRLVITEGACRGGYCKKGDAFQVEDLCPPLCHELWNVIYPMVYALRKTMAIPAQKNLTQNVPAGAECRSTEKR